MKPLIPLVCAAMAALSLAACQQVDDAAFGQRVRAYLLAHPEVLEEMATKLDEQKRTQALAAHKAGEAELPKYRAQLEGDPRDLVINPSGKVTLVQFFDYKCGYCKIASPAVVAMIRENPDVRFVFKEFPIFGGVSDTAGAIMLTPQAKSKGLALYAALMSENALDDAAIDRRLTESGLDPATVRKAAEAPAIRAQLDDTRKLAKALNIQGTPAFIIGDTMIPGADVEAIRVAITQAKAKNLKTLG